MRLSDSVRDAIVAQARHYFGEDCDLWLFGSQCDDSSFGGDIDLYIETNISTDVFAAKLEFLIAMSKVIGDEKLDVTVRHRQRPLHAIGILAMKRGIQLYPDR